MRYIAMVMMALWMPFVASAECVILLHGLARSSNSMSKLAEYLDKQGFEVVNYDYPSTEENIADTANEHIPAAMEQCETQPINFVTHSLGGILVRSYFAENDFPAGGAVVMIAPPNQGSELVDNMKEISGFEWVNGPAGLELGTDGVPSKLPAVDYPTAVIAGNVSLNPLYSNMIPGDDDGKVAVSSTKVDGMQDWVEIDASHTFIMNDKRVLEMTANFLKNGELRSQP